MLDIGAIHILLLSSKPNLAAKNMTKFRVHGSCSSEWKQLEASVTFNTNLRHQVFLISSKKL